MEGFPIFFGPEKVFPFFLVNWFSHLKDQSICGGENAFEGFPIVRSKAFEKKKTLVGLVSTNDLGLKPITNCMQRGLKIVIYIC